MAGSCQVDEILVSHVFLKACNSSNYSTFHFVLLKCSIITDNYCIDGFEVVFTGKIYYRVF